MDNGNQVISSQVAKVDGNNGWTPIFSNIERPDGNVVMQVYDWVGGGGTKPQTGLYVTANGFNSNINLATIVSIGKPVRSNLVSASSLTPGLILLGNTITNIIDQFTGESITLNRAKTVFGGAIISDDYVNNILYFKVAGLYYKRNLTENFLKIEWYGGKGDNLSDNTSAWNLATKFYSPSILFGEGIFRGNYKMGNNAKIMGKNRMVTQLRPFTNNPVIEVKQSIINTLEISNLAVVNDKSNFADLDGIKIVLDADLSDDVVMTYDFINVHDVGISGFTGWGMKVHALGANGKTRFIQLSKWRNMIISSCVKGGVSFKGNIIESSFKTFEIANCGSTDGNVELAGLSITCAKGATSTTNFITDFSYPARLTIENGVIQNNDRFSDNPNNQTTSIFHNGGRQVSFRNIDIESAYQALVIDNRPLDGTDIHIDRITSYSIYENISIQNSPFGDKPPTNGIITLNAGMNLSFRNIEVLASTAVFVINTINADQCYSIDMQNIGCTVKDYRYKVSTTSIQPYNQGINKISNGNSGAGVISNITEGLIRFNANTDFTLKLKDTQAKLTLSKGLLAINNISIKSEMILQNNNSITFGFDAETGRLFEKGRSVTSIIYASGSPVSTAPEFIGQMYNDSTTNRVWIVSGNIDAMVWTLITPS